MFADDNIAENSSLDNVESYGTIGTGVGDDRDETQSPPDLGEGADVVPPRREGADLDAPRLDEPRDLPDLRRGADVNPDRGRTDASPDQGGADVPARRDS